MNREIIFRGKRIDNGEWVEGDLVSNAFYQAIVEGKSNCCYILDYDKMEYDCFQDIFEQIDDYEVDPETVGQYTGLKDSAGKRIFEGDIVRNLQGKTAYITFLQQEMGYVVAYGKHDSRIGHRATGSPYDYDDTIEVCGNVHDNPELLEEL